MSDVLTAEGENILTHGLKPRFYDKALAVGHFSDVSHRHDFLLHNLQIDVGSICFNGRPLGEA